jgi:autotransporter-associated beta strand protein
MKMLLFGRLVGAGGAVVGYGAHKTTPMKKTILLPFVLLLAGMIAHLPPTARAGTLSVTNGSFTNLTGLTDNGGGWYGGIPAGWSTGTTPANAYTVLLSGGTYYANLQTLGAAWPPFEQNVGTVNVTSDIQLTFTLATLSGSSSAYAAIYYGTNVSYNSYSANGSTYTITVRGVDTGTSVTTSFWNVNAATAPGLTGVSILDSATTYTWNGGDSGVWTNGGGGWLDNFDNTATTYSNAKPVVAQFTNAAAGTNVTVASDGVTVGRIDVAGGDYAFTGGTITMTNTTWSVSNAIASVSNTLAGTTGLAKSGSGTLVLSASNSYSGGTTLSNGTLALSNANALGSGNLTVNGGTLDLGGNNLTAANVGGTGGTIALGTNTLTASMTTGREYQGVITGSGGLVKTGTNFLTLRGSNTYSGGTVVSGGTLFVAGSGNLGDAAGTVTVSNAVLDLRNAQTRTGTITMIGQDARILSGDTNNPGSIVNNGGALQFGGGLISASISGTGGLDVTGGGSLNASNSYTGATTISGTTGWYGANSLFVVSAHGLGAASGDLTMSGGILNLQSNTITRSGNLTISGGTVQVGTFSKSGSDYDIQGGNINVVLAGAAGLTKSSTNGASLNASNTYTGNTTISAGALQVSGTLGDAGGAVTVNGSGSGSTFVVLDLRSEQTRTGAITMTNQDARIISGNGLGSIVNNGGAFAFGGGSLEVAVSGSGGMNITGGGRITASNSYTGATVISATAGWYGTGQFFAESAHALGAASGDLTVNGGNLNLYSNTITRSGNLTVSGGTVANGTFSKSGTDYDIQGGTITAGLAGTAGLAKSGAGTATLSGSNSYSGATAVTQGVLNLNSSAGSSLGSTASVSVTNATLLISQSGQVSDSASVTLSGGTILRGSGVSETFGAPTLTAASFLDFGSGVAGNLTFGTAVGAPAFKLTVNNFFAGNTLVLGDNLTSVIPTSYTGTAFTSTYFDINSTSGGFTSAWNGSTFTITAIPEPSTLLAVAGLLGVLLWPASLRILRVAGAHRSARR